MEHRQSIRTNAERAVRAQGPVSLPPSNIGAYQQSPYCATLALASWMSHALLPLPYAGGDLHVRRRVSDTGPAGPRWGCAREVLDLLRDGPRTHAAVA